MVIIAEFYTNIKCKQVQICIYSDICFVPQGEDPADGLI